jgi:hypothetical protein
MTDIELQIESLALVDFDGDVGAVRPTLEKALSQVAARLAKSPLARLPAKRWALAELELGSLTAQELTAPGGAEKLADALYRSLERSLT